MASSQLLDEPSSHKSHAEEQNSAGSATPAPASSNDPESDFESVLWHKLQQRRRDEGSDIRTNDSVSFRGASSSKKSSNSVPNNRDFLESMTSVPSRERGVPIFPQDSIFGFYLEGQLGRGAFASVFLARQQDLAGRPIVLKVSEIEGNEPQTLAQLQHTNIVPIYSVHEDGDAGIRAVCMPYFGGAALNTVLTELSRMVPQTTQGAEFAAALKQVGGPDAHSNDKSATPEGSSPLDSIKKQTYIQTSAWLVAQLADGLFHAHQRNILHRDIKPSNILVTADGVPMLLDFNLAAPVQQSATTGKSSLGGTVAYMSPEHLKALATRDIALGRLVDKRSDIYSLGMVLFEMLAGQRAFEHSGSYSAGALVVEAMAQERGNHIPSLRQVREDIPWSLESIVRKSLHPDPAKRYQSAHELAEDLRAFLDDKPLKHAPELSVTERMQKFLRRHPGVKSALYVGSVASILLAVVTTVGWSMHLRASANLASTTQRAEVAELGHEKRNFEDGAKRALCLVHTSVEGVDHLRQGIDECEKALKIFNILQDSDWQKQPSWQRLSTSERVAFADQARELLLLLAWGRVQSHPGDEAKLKGALGLLKRAEAIDGLQPARIIFEDQAAYLGQLGKHDEADAARVRAAQTPLTTARDYYLTALSLARKGGSKNLQQARDAVNKALTLNHNHFWSMIQRGILHCELRDWDRAISDFSSAKIMWPESPLGSFSLGYIYDQKGRKTEAAEEYTWAIQRDPQYQIAYFNRGLVYAELKQHADALKDFDQVAKFGRRDAALHAARGFALDALQRNTEASAEFRTAFKLLPQATAQTRARIRLVYGFAKADDAPEEAMKAFQAVLDDSACRVDHPKAHYGLALVDVQQDRLKTALTHFDAALKQDQNFVEAHRYRGICLARLGQWTLGIQEIAWCVNRPDRTGADLYAAACYYSLLSASQNQSAEASSSANQAMQFLKHAFEAGYGMDKAAQDVDLEALRTRDDFQKLVLKTNA